MRAGKGRGREMVRAGNGRGRELVRAGNGPGCSLCATLPLATQVEERARARSRPKARPKGGQRLSLHAHTCRRRVLALLLPHLAHDALHCGAGNGGGKNMANR